MSSYNVRSCSVGRKKTESDNYVTVAGKLNDDKFQRVSTACRVAVVP